MEVIEIPGYTETEKLEIGRRYLVPRQLTENGLKPEQCQWDELALRRVISDYTHEAGVRELERQIGAVCRGVAAEIARGEQQNCRVTPEVVTVLLGPPRYVREQGLKPDMPGVVTGLAYTPTGGEVLYIEAIQYPGKGGITLTGQIGNVMKESAQAALSLLRVGRKRWASMRRLLRIPTSTCTFRPELFPRTDPRPALRCSRPLRRFSPIDVSVPMSQ